MTTWKCERCGETYFHILFGPCKRCLSKEAKAPDQADEPDPDDERDLTPAEAKLIADIMMGKRKGP